MAEKEYTLPRATFDKPVKLLIVVAPFYRDIADMLISGALAEIEASGGTHELIEVPGALEVPTAIGIAERMSNFDGYVALGCVIRGATTHYETVCNDSSRGITLLGLQGLCVGNGILTVENRDQALERADPAQMNKGAGAAAAAMHLIALERKWGGARKGVGFVPSAEEYKLAGGLKDNPTA
ncbi:6,7-dimethyl-8-ribityllumazine synthase [Roseovarius rhodophyticola]|uniref:6,7-dimethyl-8-ribityllumazine synthase n=1 Tax=Roseovarius rhodophyticola TaxID=3080827 RepID=A0ABZ2TGS7_9RHOB|nr:6,7-dimethyl-8-ribityllumazine synthase [Roseovarius sp. W115]MDV2929187.1 6,7-dimethyl-8-ribityllumazine synthase [Roseovarius sp. W115]